MVHPAHPLLSVTSPRVLWGDDGEVFSVAPFTVTVKKIALRAAEQGRPYGGHSPYQRAPARRDWWQHRSAEEEKPRPSLWEKD